MAALKVGLIARAEDRGIGLQTWEFYRHVRPERTLVVDMGPLARGFHAHFDRYPDALVVPFQRGLPETETRAWLEGLDVVYTVETSYDLRLFGWARDVGCRTIVHVNPEFFRWAIDPTMPRPDVWWAPTTWRLEHLPAETRVVPVPVAADRFTDRPARADDARLQVLHVVGRRALADRNGTLALLQALQRVTSRVSVRIVTQEARLPVVRGIAKGVSLHKTMGGIADYWRLYDGADLLVLPRRYGGLCLPAQEAMAAGLAVAMTDASPQRDDWPVELFRARQGDVVRMPGGDIVMADPDPVAVAAAIDRLALDRDALAEAQRTGLAWAQAHSWETLLPRYQAELAWAADRRVAS